MKLTIFNGLEWYSREVDASPVRPLDYIFPASGKNYLKSGTSSLSELESRYRLKDALAIEKGEEVYYSLDDEDFVVCCNAAGDLTASRSTFKRATHASRS